MMFREFSEADSFTCAAFGEPGQRTFVLQIRQAGERMTIKCEKQQVAALSQYLRQLLADAPDVVDRPLEESMQVATPIEISFVLGTVGIAYDPRHDRVVLQIDEMVPAAEDGEDDMEQPALTDEPAGDRVRIHISRGQAAAFCEHADDVVAAGRPTCLFCGRPVNVDGHACPRMN
jgi:uncharacterized repeat protein (TIGR03847 family)